MSTALSEAAQLKFRDPTGARALGQAIDKVTREIGRDPVSVMVYGEYPETDDDKPPLFLPSGIIRNRNLGKVEPLDPAKITESVKHSWYEDGAGQPLHPREGLTQPKYTGPKPPYERLETAAKYSWLKSPRYDGEPMEVGPLARMLVAYGSGHKRVQELVGTALKSLGVGPEALFSTLGRIAARCVETVLLTEKIDGWVDALAVNMNANGLIFARHLIHDPAGMVVKNAAFVVLMWVAAAQGRR